jgi:hypothetical protein
MPPELLPVDFHPVVRYIFDYWSSLNRRRVAFNPISDLDIFAWSSLRGIPLNSFELDVLERLEDLYFKVVINPKIEEMRKKPR